MLNPIKNSGENEEHPLPVEESVFHDFTLTLEPSAKVLVVKILESLLDPTGSPSANRKSLEDKLIKLAVTLQMFQFTSRQIRPLTRLREEGFAQMVAEELGPEETDHNRLMREYMRIALQHILEMMKHAPSLLSIRNLCRI